MTANRTDKLYLRYRLQTLPDPGLRRAGINFRTQDSLCTLHRSQSISIGRWVVPESTTGLRRSRSYRIVKSSLPRPHT